MTAKDGVLVWSKQCVSCELPDAEHLQQHLSSMRHLFNMLHVAAFRKPKQRQASVVLWVSLGAMAGLEDANALSELGTHFFASLW